MNGPDIDKMEAAARTALTETEGARWAHHGEHEQVCYPMGEGGVNFLDLGGPRSDTIVRWALAWQPIEALAIVAYVRDLEERLARAGKLDARVSAMERRMADRGTPHRCPVCEGKGRIGIMGADRCPTCRGDRILWSRS